MQPVIQLFLIVATLLINLNVQGQTTLNARIKFIKKQFKTINKMKLNSLKEEGCTFYYKGTTLYKVIDPDAFEGSRYEIYFDEEKVFFVFERPTDGSDKYENRYYYDERPFMIRFLKKDNKEVHPDSLEFDRSDFEILTKVKNYYDLWESHWQKSNNPEYKTIIDKVDSLTAGYDDMIHREDCEQGGEHEDFEECQAFDINDNLILETSSSHTDHGSDESTCAFFDDDEIYCESYNSTWSFFMSYDIDNPTTKDDEVWSETYSYDGYTITISRSEISTSWGFRLETFDCYDISKE